MIRIILLFLVISINSSAQNWSPIYLNTKSVFTQNKYPTPLACFSIDSVNQIGTDSTFYYNYQLYGQNTNDSSDYSACSGFGDDCYLIQNEMSWLGRTIINVNDDWIFITENRDSLTFNFETTDTVVVFQSLTNTLKLFRYNDTVANFLGTQDSIREYKVLHYNSQGNLLQDSFAQKTIRLSKTRGLLDFIEVKNYPNTISFYTLLGSFNNQDTIGKINIKEYEIYNSAPGTITQFEVKKETYTGCCPSVQPGYYYLETYETQNSSFLGADFILTFSKNEVIDSVVIDTNRILYSIPFIRDSSNQRINITIDSTTCYGNGYYVSTNYSDCEFFCPDFNCYSQSEPVVNSYCSFFTLENKPNIRAVLTSTNNNTNNSIPEEERNLIYTLVNGVSCGTRAYSSINENNESKDLIYPNPTSDYLNLQNINTTKLSVSILDLNGKTIKVFKNQAKQIDVRFLATGVYLLEINSEEGKFRKSLIIKR